MDSSLNPLKATRPLTRRLMAVAAMALSVGAGLALTRGTAAGEVAAPPPPPVQVTVQTLAPKPIRVWSEFSGRLHAVDSAELRPEVAGRITEVRFEDGQDVRAGEVLFVIDPRPYEAAVARAEANLASARTNASFARLELDRAANMIKTQAIAQRIYDERANASRVAESAVKAAEADLKQASLDLEHAYVKAPIAGRASRAEITIGNLVQPGPAAPLLTTIVGNHAIYADFAVDEQTYLEAIEGQAQGGEAGNGRAAERQIPVVLAVEGNQSRRHEGTIYSFDNHIDVASGTIRARAKFDNQDGTLVPGMFVTVKLAGGHERPELLIPEQAIGFDQSKKFVYVVGPDGKVAYREVELGNEVGAARVALKGVVAGDRVIVNGIQHVRPDAVVDPHEAPPLQTADKS